MIITKDNPIDIPNDIQSDHDGFILAPTGLEIDYPEQVTFRDWLEQAYVLLDIHRQHPWWVGDLFAFGEDHFPEEFAGVLSDRWPNETTSIRQMVWVSRMIPMSIRDRRLSYSHYRVIAGLPAEKRAEAVKAALTDDLTVLELRWWAATALDDETYHVKGQRSDLSAADRLITRALLERGVAGIPEPEARDTARGITDTLIEHLAMHPDYEALTEFPERCQHERGWWLALAGKAIANAQALDPDAAEALADAASILAAETDKLAETASRRLRSSAT